MKSSLRSIIRECAQVLLHRRNPVDGGWGLNISRGHQASSIVNTAESLFVLRAASVGFHDMEASLEFISKNIFKHAKDPRRHDNIRYLSFGVLGLLWGEYSPKHSLIKEATRKIRSRFKEGWDELVDEPVSMWSSFFALWALGETRGWQTIAKEYASFLRSLRASLHQGTKTPILTIENSPSLAKVSYATIVVALALGLDAAAEGRELVASLLEEALRENKAIEVEAVPGTDWHHYSLCWAVKALLGSRTSNDDSHYILCQRAISYILHSWREGKGFVEPDSGVINVRSIFNACIALDAYLESITVSHIISRLGSHDDVSAPSALLDEPAQLQRLSINGEGGVKLIEYLPTGEFWISGKNIEFGPKEVIVLRYLLKNFPNLCTREDLLTECLGYPKDVLWEVSASGHKKLNAGWAKGLSDIVSDIRTKIREVQPKLDIKCVKTIGYRLVSRN